MRVLGIEGTAWAASAAVFEYDPDDMVCPTLLENGFVHNAPVS